MFKKAMLMFAAVPTLFALGGCGGFSWETVHDLAIHVNQIAQFAAALGQLGAV